MTHSSINASAIVRSLGLSAVTLLMSADLLLPASAAPGDVDLTFDPGSGINGTVHAIAVQLDGKVIIAGQFTTVRGLLRPHLARLNSDGTGDATFQADAAADAYVSAVLVQSDGKILFTRDFFNLTGAPSGAKVARFNHDGSLDTGFQPELGAFLVGSGLTCAALQPDGKVVLGGYSNDFHVDEENGLHPVKRSLLIRLHADGSRDDGFANGDGSLGTALGASAAQLSSIAIQGDGKLIVGGSSLVYELGGQAHHGSARLNPDGSLDSTFVPQVDGYVRAVSALAGGRTLLAGSFIGTGENRHALAVLNPDGSRDEGFNPSAGGLHSVNSLAISPGGGTILASGSAWDGDDAPRTRIIRLHADGEVDASFDAGTGPDQPDNGGTVLALQPDGMICIGGSIRQFHDTSRAHTVRLNTDGSLDAAFDPGASINGPVNGIVLEPDGRLLIRGQFTSVHGADRNRVARLHPSGALDTDFDSALGVSGGFHRSEVTALAAQTDGKVMIGGDLSSVSGTSRYRLARLDSTGAVDTSFVSDIGGIGFDARPVQAIAMLADGRMLIAEPGGTDGLNSPRKIARLDSSGKGDNTFNPVIAPGLPGIYHTEANALLVQPDGKVLVAGSSLYDDFQYQAALVLRLNADGSVDAGFERTDTEGPSPSLVTTISALALQPDGKVFIGGNFADIKGTSRNGIARLNADGTLDSTFDPGSGVTGTYDPTVFSIHLQPDGRILIGGSFSSFNAIARNNIARLNPDGSLDTEYDPSWGTNGVVRSIAMQSDGKVLVSGDFTTVDGIVRPHLARLLGDAMMPSLSIERAGPHVLLSWSVTGREVQLEEAAELARPDSWSSVAEPPVIGPDRTSVTVPLSTSSRFFRLKDQ